MPSPSFHFHLLAIYLLWRKNCNEFSNTTCLNVLCIFYLFQNRLKNGNLALFQTHFYFTIRSSFRNTQKGWQTVKVTTLKNNNTSAAAGLKMAFRPTFTTFTLYSSSVAHWLLALRDRGSYPVGDKTFPWHLLYCYLKQSEFYLKIFIAKFFRFNIFIAFLCHWYFAIIIFRRMHWRLKLTTQVFVA